MHILCLLALFTIALCENSNLDTYNDTYNNSVNFIEKNTELYQIFNL